MTPAQVFLCTGYSTKLIWSLCTYFVTTFTSLSHTLSHTLSHSLSFTLSHRLSPSNTHFTSATHNHQLSSSSSSRLPYSHTSDYQSPQLISRSSAWFHDLRPQSGSNDTSPTAHSFTRRLRPRHHQHHQPTYLDMAVHLSDVEDQTSSPPPASSPDHHHQHQNQAPVASINNMVAIAGSQCSLGSDPTDHVIIPDDEVRGLDYIYI